jgi:hypothetical protein
MVRRIGEEEGHLALVSLHNYINQHPHYVYYIMRILIISNHASTALTKK